jgi:hypothetical protein
MRFILLLFSRIAAIAKAMSMTIMITNIQLSTESGSNPVTEATKQHRWIFGAYIVVLVLVALFSYLVWTSGNNLSEAIQSDAKARIAKVEADARTEIARVESGAQERISEAQRESNEKIARLKSEADKGIAQADAEAAQANQQTKKLESDNLKLQANVATLEKDAAEARTKQAQAETMLANIVKRQNPRILDSKTFLEKLKDKPKARVEIMYQENEPEPFGLAVQIRRWLGEGVNGDGAGWDVPDPKPISPEWLPPNVPTNMPLASSYLTIWGLTVVTSKSWKGEDDDAMGALMVALMASGISFIRMVNPKLPPDLFVIVIGPKV